VVVDAMELGIPATLAQAEQVAAVVVLDGLPQKLLELF
jgi:hypothetical protein